MIIRKNKTIAVFGSTLGLLAGALAFPAMATAAPTVCSPGYVNTTFSQSAAGFHAAGSVSGTNTTDTTREILFTVDHGVSLAASVTGSVSVDSVLSPVKAQLSATATSSQSWSAGVQIPVTLAPHQTSVITYGYNTVTFTGSQKTCGNDGQFGPSSSFSGVAPTGTHVNF